METTELNTLLKRFYDGQTTAEEETRLRYLLHSDALSPENAADRQFLDGLCSPSATAPADLEKRLSRQIDGWNAVEKTTGRHARVIALRWVAGIAASLTLLFSLGLFLNRHDGTAQIAVQETAPANLQDTYSDPQDAYATTQRALMKFSQGLNKGLKTMEKATE